MCFCGAPCIEGRTDTASHQRSDLLIRKPEKEGRLLVSSEAALAVCPLGELVHCWDSCVYSRDKFFRTRNHRYHRSQMSLANVR